MRQRLNAPYMLLVLIVVSAISLVLCTCLGPVSLKPAAVAKIILSGIPIIGEKIVPDWSSTEYAVIMTTRLPRVLLGLVSGCALAVGRTALQGLVHNQLADPYILGASYGASAFAAIGTIIGLFSFMGVYQNSVNGYIGALLSLVLVYAYAHEKGYINISHLLLGGIAFSLFAKATVQIVALTNLQVFRC